MGKLFEQDWFIEAINPSEVEKKALNDKFQEILDGTTKEMTDSGVESQTVVITVCKKILGRQ